MEQQPNTWNGPVTGRELLTPAEVAELFKVDPKTVTRWAKSGKLTTATRTLGGHRRFHRAEVEALLTASQESAS